MRDPIEVVGVLGINGSLVQLRDGSLLANDGRVSRDGGRTWSDPRPFGDGISGTGLLRLASDELTLIAPAGYGAARAWVSRDEAKTWRDAGAIAVPGGPVYEVGDIMIQLKSGRLLYCWDYNMAAH